MADPTPTYRLADLVVEGGIASYVTARRAASESWRKIARSLWTDTEGRVDVTHETLRSWFPDAEAADPPSAA